MTRYAIPPEPTDKPVWVTDEDGNVGRAVHSRAPHGDTYWTVFGKSYRWLSLLENYDYVSDEAPPAWGLHGTTLPWRASVGLIIDAAGERVAIFGNVLSTLANDTKLVEHVVRLVNRDADKPASIDRDEYPRE